MESKKKSKRGDMTAQTLIGIILVLIGLGIVLFVYSQLGWFGNVDREVCHQSVIMRGTLPKSYGIQEYVPLKCATKKACIGDKCDVFENTKGIEKVKVSEIRDVERYISQEMVDCWIMMGEGKISVFSSGAAELYGLEKVYPTCVVCSRIAFDKNLKLKDGTPADVDILKYMLTHKMPNQDVSYYEYFAGEKGDFTIKNGILYKVQDGSLQTFQPKEIIGDDLKKIVEGLSIGEEDTKTQQYIQEIENSLNNPSGSSETQTSGNNQEVAVLFMQISSPGHWDSLKNIARETALGGIAGHFMSFGITTKLAREVIFANPLVSGISLIVGVGIQQGSVWYNQNYVTAGYCGTLPFGEDTRDGCSVVRVVNYDMNDIKKYCSVIESVS